MAQGARLVGLGRRTAAEDEYWLGELDDGEAPEVQRVDAMADDSDGSQAEWESVDEDEEDLQGDDGVD